MHRGFESLPLRKTPHQRGFGFLGGIRTRREGSKTAKGRFDGERREAAPKGGGIDLYILFMHITVQVTRIGRVGIAEENGLITNLFFEGELPVPEPRSEASPLTNEAFRQLAAYLRGELKTFSFPMAPSSTPFSTQVRKALLRVPYGTTVTYAAIADSIGSPSASRAVGRACSRNPLPIFIPCHRVVPSSGRLGGYRGGMELKAALIYLEKPQ